MNISMPKALGGSKEERKTSIEVKDSKAWIPFDEMCRVTNADPQSILDSMPEYHKAVKLIDLERDWSVFQALYSVSPQSFEDTDDLSKMILDLLKTNRRPIHVLAMMDLSMIRFLIMAKRSAATTEPVVAKCAACGVQNPHLRCSACKETACINVLYCTKECQVKHWKTHKKVCCKNKITNKEADKLRRLMNPEQIDAKAKVEMLEGIMSACALAHE